MGTHSRISFNVQKHVVKHPLKSKIRVHCYLQKTSMSIKMSEEGQIKYYMCVL